MANAGWYPDPYGRAEWRWFDGTSWTPDVSGGGSTWSEAASGSQTPQGPPTGPLSQTTAPAGGGAPSGQIVRYVLAGVVALVLGILVAVLLTGGGDGGAPLGATSPGATAPAGGTAGGTTGDSTGGTTDGATAGTTTGGETGTTTGEVTDPLITGEMVPVQQGLGQLDSYTFTVTQTSVGPTEQDRSETTSVLQRDEAADATYTSTRTATAGAEAPEGQTSTSEQWQVGTMTCSATDGEFTAQDHSPAGRELADALRGLIDLLPVAPDPQRVGEEMVNGVAAVHFTFALPGLGQESGAEVITNQGDYWLALDGGYVVRYELQLELRTGPAEEPQSEIHRGSLVADLTGINQGAAVSMPAECAAAGAAPA